MNTLSKKNLFKVVFLTFCLNITLAQQKNKTIESDPKIDKILEEKRKMNTGIIVNDTYKIQIFFGNLEQAKANLIQFKKDFKNTDGTIVFKTPNYKVLVGSYKTKFEADKNLISIKKKFPSALIIDNQKK